MLNFAFLVALTVGFFALLTWGVRTLSAERWQMLAAVPVAKAEDGSWRGANFTFYGFFSATGTSFGFAMMLLLLASLGIPVRMAILLGLVLLAICLPASRLIAGLVERKRNTFTVAGAAFVASLIFPSVILALQPLAAKVLHREVAILPILAAVAISYALGESIGRLACLSFGCCYGMRLRDAKPVLARLFQRHNLVIHGPTKKAAYASGLAGEPLVPVQAITSVVFATSGLVGLGLFLLQHFRLAALIPATASWGWRACSEWLRADYRGGSRISVYQAMAMISVLYLNLLLASLPPSSVVRPDLSAAFAQFSCAAIILALQIFWAALFLYYGRSRVTASTVSFYVIADRV
jgi:hypothetical protein